MEWLTTGQMIDKLERGKVAITDEGDKMYWDSSSLELVIKSSRGKKLNYLVFDIKNIKWRLLRKDVSFEEAIKALKEGRIAFLEVDDRKIKFLGIGDYKAKDLNITLKQLYEGHWSVDYDS